MKKKTCYLIIVCCLFLCLLFILEYINLNRGSFANKEVVNVIDVDNTKEIDAINDKYSAFIEGNRIELDDEISLFLNEQIDIHEKINSITIDDINISNILNRDKYYEYLMEEKVLIDSLEYGNIDSVINNLSSVEKETLLNIYNNSVIVLNISDDLNKLDDIKNDINRKMIGIKIFMDNEDDYYITNQQVICLNDGFKQKVAALNLNIVVQDEKVLGKKIPILMYHGVDDETWGNAGLFVRPSELEQQMKYLYENGYTTLFLSEIEEASNYDKPVIITFDDGYMDVYKYGYPILQKYNIKFNFFIITRWMDGETYVTPSIVEEMSESGIVEIGSHTLSHVSLGWNGYDKQLIEIGTSKSDLENLLNKSITTIAYPVGSYNANTINISANYYTYGVTTESGYNYSNYLNKLKLKRFRVSRGTGLGSFASIVS